MGALMLMGDPFLLFLSWELPGADSLARWCGEGGRKTCPYPIVRSLMSELR